MYNILFMYSVCDNYVNTFIISIIIINDLLFFLLLLLLLIIILLFFFNIIRIYHVRYI